MHHNSHKVTFRDATDSLELESLLASKEREQAGLLSAAPPLSRSNSKSPGPAGYPAHEPPTLQEVKNKQTFDNDALSELAGKKKQTPIPYLQVFFVAIWRMSQSLFFIAPMPFLNTMLVEDLAVANEKSVGKYSGLVEAAAAAGMISGVFLFAHLSDKYGRKWITVIGVGAASIMCALFGFGQTFFQLLVLRFTMGFANSAQAATARVMISEMTDSSNEAISFAFMGTGWQIGATVAPVIGAGLAHPERTWPSLFEDTIFSRYPYSLPCVVASFVPFIVVLFAIFLEEETHPGRRAGKGERAIGAKYSKLPNSPTSPAVIARKESHPNIMPAAQEKESIFSCGAGFILLMRFLMLVQALWNGAAELLLFFSSTKIGGLGLSQTQMSIFLSIRPLLVCLFTLCVCPSLFRKYNNVQILRFFICFVPLATAMFLLLSCFAFAGMASPAVVIISLGVVLVLQTISNPHFLASNVLLNARAPSQEQLSQLNACSELVSQIGIGLGAELGSTLYAWGNEWPLLPGRLSWVGLLIVNTVTSLVAQKTTQVDGWRERKADMEDEEKE